MKPDSRLTQTVACRRMEAGQCDIYINLHKEVRIYRFDTGETRIRVRWHLNIMIFKNGRRIACLRVKSGEQVLEKMPKSVDNCLNRACLKRPAKKTLKEFLSQAMLGGQWVDRVWNELVQL